MPQKALNEVNTRIVLHQVVRYAVPQAVQGNFLVNDDLVARPLNDFLYAFT